MERLWICLLRVWAQKILIMSCCSHFITTENRKVCLSDDFVFKSLLAPTNSNWLSGVKNWMMPLLSCIPLSQSLKRRSLLKLFQKESQEVTREVGQASHPYLGQGHHHMHPWLMMKFYGLLSSSRKCSSWVFLPMSLKLNLSVSRKGNDLHVLNTVHIENWI